jgi:hypothetical protein
MAQVSIDRAIHVDSLVKTASRHLWTSMNASPWLALIVLMVGSFLIVLDFFISR